MVTEGILVLIEHLMIKRNAMPLCCRFWWNKVDFPYKNTMKTSLFQAEYREVKKNSELIIDASYNSGYKNK